MKVEFHVWLLISTIKLTRVFKFQTDCALLWRSNNQEITVQTGVAMHAYGVSAYYT